MKSVKIDEYEFTGEIDIDRVCLEKEKDGTLGFIVVGPVDCVLLYREDTTDLFRDKKLIHSNRRGFFLVDCKAENIGKFQSENTGKFQVVKLFDKKYLPTYRKDLKDHVEKFKNRPKFSVISAK